MKGYRTYAVATLMILHALGSYALGQNPQVDLTEVLTALGLAALRAAVAKGPSAAALLAALLLPCGLAAAAPPPEPGTKAGLAYTQPRPGRLYVDSFLSLSTADFTEADYGYGIGVGYQVTKHWSGELRVAHKGLDAEGSAIQELGGRLVARMPFEFLSPYTFLGASFDLETDRWRIQPGAGLELGVSKSLRGLSLFAEGGLDADLHGRNGYQFVLGGRVRF